MSHYSIHDIDKVVRLVCQNNLADLQCAALEIVAESLYGIEYRLYGISYTNEEEPFRLLNEEDNEKKKACFHRDLPVLQKLYQNEPISSPDTQIVPVNHKGKLFAALVLDTDPSFHNSIQAHFISAILAMYSSQYAKLIRATQDSLTRLLNRQMLSDSMDRVLDQLHDIIRRKGDKGIETWCLAIIDIDHFKRVNDQYGHLIGDEVILQLAQLMHASFRKNDLLFRYGGEEFSVLLSNASLEDTEMVMDRFRKRVENHNFPQIKTVTVSIGYTQITPDEFPSALLDQADRALYYSKEHGRNQSHGYEELIEQNKLQHKDSGYQGIELFE